MKTALKNILILLFVFTLSGDILAQVSQKNKRPQRDQNEVLAMQYYRNKEYDKARLLFEDLYKKKSEARYYPYLLQCLLETKDLKAAEKITRKQIRKNTDNYRYYIELGYIYSLQGKTEKAQEQYQNVLKKLPANENLILQVSNSFLIRGKNDLAIQTLEKGKQILNKKYAFNLSLASAYYRVGDFDKMIAEYLEYLIYDQNGLAQIKNRLQYQLNGLAGESIRQRLHEQLLLKYQKNPDVAQYAEMLYWLSIQEKDFEFALTQAKAIDRRFGENGQRLRDLAHLSFENDDFDVAIQAFDVLLEKGSNNPFYLDAQTGILKARFEKITHDPGYTKKDLIELKKDYKTTLEELGKNPFTVNLINAYAHLLAYYLDDLDSSVELLLEAIQVTNARPADVANSKLELGNIYLFKDEVWEATLLYSQVEKAFKSEPLGHEAKLRNAKLYYYIGEFGWAKSKLDVLKAATSKLIANDALELSMIIQDNTNYDSTTTELAIFAAADLLFYQNKKLAALNVLDSMETFLGTHPIKDEVLFKKAEIYFSMGAFSKADSLYQMVIEVNPYDNILADNALFKSAVLNQENLNNPDKALELYQQILTDYPGSIFTIEARKRLRALRGDKLE
jgi:tetratricopeptide (TPR) repeat protein